MRLLQIVVVVSLAALISAACFQYEPEPTSEDNRASDTVGEAAAPDRLTGTVWEGTVDHQNCEGCCSSITWHFLPEGKLQQTRWENIVTMGTWKLEGDEIEVDLPQRGCIILKRDGDKIEGETCFRGGYGYGWEYKMELKK